MPYMTLTLSQKRRSCGESSKRVSKGLNSSFNWRNFNKVAIHSLPCGENLVLKLSEGWIYIFMKCWGFRHLRSPAEDRYYDDATTETTEIV